MIALEILFALVGVVLAVVAYQATATWTVDLDRRGAVHRYEHRWLAGRLFVRRHRGHWVEVD